jgi:hypothetical protein
MKQNTAQLAESVVTADLDKLGKSNGVVGADVRGFA